MSSAYYTDVGFILIKRRILVEKGVPYYLLTAEKHSVAGNYFIINVRYCYSRRLLKYSLPTVLTEYSSSQLLIQHSPKLHSQFPITAKYCGIVAVCCGCCRFVAVKCFLCLFRSTLVVHSERVTGRLCHNIANV